MEGYQYKGERRKRSTDPVWSVDVYKIKDRYVQKHQPTLYYLDGGLVDVESVGVYKIKDRYVQKHEPTLYYLDGGPKRYFLFEELQPIHDL